jgi:hypothetical protein
MEEVKTKLVITKEDYDMLLTGCAIVPRGDDTYSLRVNIDNTDIAYYIDISDVIFSTFEDEQHSSDIIIRKKTTYSSKELKTTYETFKSNFPTTDRHHNFVKSRVLRVDPGKKAFGNYKKLISDYNIKPEDILNAMQYEVWWRCKVSLKDGKNRLTYMQGMAAWLNNVENVKTQLEEIAEDQSYHQFREEHGTNVLKEIETNVFNDL